MNISELANYGNQNIGLHENMGTNQNASGVSESGTRNAISGAQILDAFVPGNQVRGTVLSMDDGTLSLKLEQGGTISARVENANITLGSVLNFEVRAKDGGQIVLSPLQTNLSQDNSILKALNMAGIPADERSIAMTDEMMKQGMNIAPKNLAEMMRQVNILPEAKADDIVQMKQLSLPISQDMYESFVGLKNQTTQILDGAREIADGLTSVLGEVASEGDMEKLGKLFSDILGEVDDELHTLFPSDDKMQAEANANNGQTEIGGLSSDKMTGPGLQSEVSEKGDINLLNNINEQSEESYNNPSVRETAKYDVPDNVKTDNNGNDILASDNDQAGVQSKLSAAEKALAALKSFGAEDKINSDVTNKASGKDIESLGAGDTKSAFGELIRTVEREKKPDVTDSGEVKKENYAAIGEKVKSILNREGFAGELQKVISRKMLIKPEEIAEDDAVKKLYERVLRETQSLQKALESAGKENSEGAKPLQNMQKNVDFLNELNQNFAYLQLPIKMDQQNSNGDLYVYTNKKNMARSDGAVTAMLRLGMDHLGNMDIYVALKDNVVSTKFYLEDEPVIDFLADHMDELDGHLNDKGYRLNSKVMPMDTKEEGSPFDEMLKDAVTIGGITPGATFLARQSFEALV